VATALPFPFHVSIAYAEGSAPLNELKGIASEIATRDFSLGVRGLEVLQGETTPYDYLVLSLDGGMAFQSAVSRVEKRLSTRQFTGGFKTHVSLFKFTKGILKPEVARSLCARLASRLKLERLTVHGERVCVYDSSREQCCQVPIEAPELAA
jgi:hypothetical protein